MKKQSKIRLSLACALFLAFVVWTILVRFVDRSAIGPKDSLVGFATLNGFIHNFTGENFFLYMLTDWFGLVPIGVVIGFAILGLIQWIKRKSLKRVDYDIFVLGGFYLIVMLAYLLFEILPINYRPVLIDGKLESSYPSSTTLLVLCVMPTTILQMQKRIKNKIFRRCMAVIILAFTLFTVVARILSGVHWISDIVGGILLSASLVVAYDGFVKIKEDRL